MDQANDSSTIILSRTIMSSLRSAVTALPSPERMTITQSNHNQHHGDNEESADEAQRRRVCFYLQQALDLVDITEIDFLENAFEDEEERSLKK
jgi:hypothetical protein